jgi:N-methylhydantoinase A/oxoprolinase/acetone carboxylase beta subunit
MAPIHQSRQPPVGLGIDVGGTFSDTVLIDFDGGHVLSKAKSPTTHDDLVKGIKNSIGLLDRSFFSNIQLTSLSTTLATNALVEGRRSRVAAILAGYQPPTCPREFMQDIYLVEGGHTADGEEFSALDLEGVERIIESTWDRVEAYAVSAYFSTRNPSHELKIKQLITELAPGIPIACGYELSQKLNAKHRATTTILNAHLIPLIRHLLFSVKKVLRGFSIQAPLMVVKGDGSLFREDVCLARPVETILSGPAASVVGAGFLMHRLGHLAEKAVVMDIGGTTSDVALLDKGHPRVNEEGVSVGPWQTHVAAVDVRTMGLGGDSQIRTNGKGEILIGPKRVEPLCLLGKRFPTLLGQLQSLASQPVKDPRFTPVMFWYRTDKAETNHLSKREESILKILSEGPRNIYQISERLDAYPLTLREALNRLEDQALIGRSGFTPTDIFHIYKLYRPGCRECSIAAAQFLAKESDTDMETFLLKVRELFHRKAGLHIVENLSCHSVSYADLERSCPACHQIWQSCFWERGDRAQQSEIGLFRMRVALDTPLVAIGAPAHILVPPLAKHMEVEEFIPEHAEVANAIGAIVGAVVIHEQVLIQPLAPKGFACFTSRGKSVYPTFEDAAGRARKYLTEYLHSEVRRAGGDECETSVWEERKQAGLATGEKIIVEVVMHGRAVAKPGFQAKPGGLN